MRHYRSEEYRFRGICAAVVNANSRRDGSVTGTAGHIGKNTVKKGDTAMEREKEQIILKECNDEITASKVTGEMNHNQGVAVVE